MIGRMFGLLAAVLAASVLSTPPASASQWPIFFEQQTGEVVRCHQGDDAGFGIAVSRKGGVWREWVHCDGKIYGQRANGTWAKWQGKKTGEVVLCRGKIAIDPADADGWALAHCDGKTLKRWR